MKDAFVVVRTIGGVVNLALREAKNTSFEELRHDLDKRHTLMLNEATVFGFNDESGRAVTYTRVPLL